MRRERRIASPMVLSDAVTSRASADLCSSKGEKMSLTNCGRMEAVLYAAFALLVATASSKKYATMYLYWFLSLFLLSPQ